MRVTMLENKVGVQCTYSFEKRVIIMSFILVPVWAPTQATIGNDKKRIPKTSSAVCRESEDHLRLDGVFVLVQVKLRHSFVAIRKIYASSVSKGKICSSSSSRYLHGEIKQPIHSSYP